MKCYVITISKTFPKGHIREGEPTNFATSIAEKTKIHTIRGNYDLWRKRFDQIEAGEAYLSVREWTGKPYASKQNELFRFDKSDGIGIQNIKFIINDFIIDQEKYFGNYLGELAQNDGLSTHEFQDWFKNSDDSPKAIIHLTGFRY